MTALFSDDSGFTMRDACSSCGHAMGRIVERGAQDCVYCLGCDRWCYNAPRVETGKAVRSVKTVHSALKPKRRAEILMRACRRCELCGRTSADGELHVGHLLSVADGLSQGLTEDIINSPENLCALCDACNLGMGKQTIPLRLAAAILRARHAYGELDRKEGKG